MDILFIRVGNREEIGHVADLARKTWTEAYADIVPIEQTEYMLEKFQSADEIGRRIASGERYYLVKFGGRKAAYFCIVDEGKKTFLSKIYVDSEFQRRGIATAILDFIRDISKHEGSESIYLTVNRRNSPAIAFYGASGFKIVSNAVKDIGNGFVMDDHIMELIL